MSDNDLENGIKINTLEMIDSMPWSVCIYDPNARVIMVNRRLCENLHINPEDWIGKSAEQIKKDGYLDKSIVTEAIAKRKTVYGVTRLRTGLEGLSVCQPIFNNNGDIKFLVLCSPLTKDHQEIKTLIEDHQNREKLSLREIEYLRNLLLLNQDDVFASPSMNSILETVKKISCMDCTVLITGESGVGKEVIAKIIHRNSTRKNGPFIPVNISAIPETLLESELYGYKQGAFTGAAKEGKVGLFEIAEGGTLFLDEVGDIPLGMQVKLLRALDTGEMTRVGDTQSKKMDVRIIAASNRKMEDEIEKGNFREDLYYRLNVVPIKIVPLRERQEDIWPLCHHFLQRINRKYNIKKVFSPQILDQFKMYHWPGNVRELRNVIERLAILSRADEISPDDFNSLIGISPFGKEPGGTLNEYETYEQSRILSAMKQANGNKTQAAKILGMQRSKLYRKLR
jgi:transcriptional regulator with PAS, ATPase and Fis domain